MRQLKTGARTNGLEVEPMIVPGNGQGPAIRPSKRPVLITGGAGFIGTNVAHKYLSAGQPVILYDNLSRPGVEQNWHWLRSQHGNLVRLEMGDIRNLRRLKNVVKEASQIFHFAAQVAVTSSLVDPLFDFEVNARGTLNLLEAVRAMQNPPPLIFTSTNKVYGELQDVKLRMSRGRYLPQDSAVSEYGFSEERALHFHSPYGCSKGAACQYVLDYARTFHLPALVFRMSCIYGPHQFGTEDQGWVAHFIIRALDDSPITIYGDGRQVRDILFVDDLTSAFLLGQQHIHSLAGEAFNIGGGPNNTISLLELINMISEIRDEEVSVRFEDWRTADQRYYVSDIRKFGAATGWKPRVGVRDGVAQLCHWLQESRLARGDGIIRVGEVSTPLRVTGLTTVPKKSTKRRTKVKTLFANRLARRTSQSKLAKAA